MRRYFLGTCVLFIALAFGGVRSFAVDEQITDRYPSTSQPPEKIKEVEEDVPFERKLTEITGFVDLQQGYDNNVDLNSQRHKDGFLQGTANIDVKYEQADNLKLRAGVDLFEAIYYKHNVNNLLDVSPYAGFDLEITPEIISRNRVMFEYFSYPNKKESTFSGIVLTSYLRHYISRTLYQEVGYEYIRRWYPDKKVALHEAQEGNIDRGDERYRVKYNVGMYSDRFFVRLSNEFARNNSNYTYQEYYDYWYYRVKPSIMYFFTEKLYTAVGVIYKRTKYKDRRSTDDPTKIVIDNTVICDATLYYDITSGMTFGLTYAYSENFSNDPYQQYSGSVVSGGIYYSF